MKGLWQRIMGGKASDEKRSPALVRVRGRLLNTPLAIEPGKLEVLVSALGDRIDVELRVDPDKVEARHAQAAGGAALAVDAPTVAIIPVHGTLVQRSMGMLDDWSGLTSYAALRSMFDAAIADPSVREIVLDIDSGGGEVAGLQDLVEHIIKLRGTKPVTAIVNEFACSAAYWLASAADRIVAPRSALVGSIGVVAMHVDQSAHDQARGLKVTHVIAGTHKVDTTPHKELSDDGRTWLQSMVDSMYGMFVEGVAANRGLSADAVRATEAQVYMADGALTLGLIDEVRSASDELDAILARVAGGEAAPVEEPEEAPVEDPPVEVPPTDEPADDNVPSDDEVEPEAKAAPLSVEAQIEAARVAAVEAERARIVGIGHVCATFGVPDLASQLVAKGASIETARIQASHYAAAQGPVILPDVDPMADAGPSAAAQLAAAMKRRNEKKR